MATRNLFRFVSVRPPILAAADDACRLINMEAGTQFVEQVLTLQRRLGGSLQVARRAVSVGFIESLDYFVRSEAWKDLRPQRKYFQDLVEEACRTEEEPGDGADGKARPREINSSLGEQVRGWVVDDSDSFANAKNSLWYSYYANVLAPELRPNDRPEMLDWIRLVAAFERLRPPAEDAEWRYEEGCACVNRLSRARVNMPHELFTEAPPPPDRVPDRPEDPVTRDIAALRASLERLDDARRNLDRLYRRKVNALRLASPPDRERGDTEAARPQRAEGGDDVESVTVGEGPRSSRPAWLLTEEDVDQLSNLGAELDRLGIPLAGSLVPEVASALDEAIAADTAALDALESRVDILGIGPTMTLARRTVRSFRPAPRGRAGSEEQADREGQEGPR